VLIFAVMPQVMARFVGLAVYQLDSNLRNSTMVGIVGGGGIGAPLFTAYQRFDYDVVLTILLCIIGLIMLAEMVSGRIRRIFQ
jgi:phosphonate transport system permease protein